MVRDQEAEGPRSVLVTEGWVSWVPFWARWPYEVLLAPRRDLASLLALTEDEQGDLARHLGLLLKAYDRHFACRTPYSFGWHGWHGLANAPPGLLLHAHLLPPLLNGPDRQKFMVGSELLAETQRDLTPEAAAAALRAALPRPPNSTTHDFSKDLIMEALNLLSQRRSSRAAELADQARRGCFNGFSRPVFAFPITVAWPLAPSGASRGRPGLGRRGSRSVLRW